MAEAKQQKLNPLIRTNNIKKKKRNAKKKKEIIITRPQLQVKETLFTSNKIIRAYLHSNIFKALNGAMAGGSTSNLLKLDSVLYTFKRKRQSKKNEQEQTDNTQDENSEVVPDNIKSVFTYLIKGVRGSLRHTASQICFEKGLETCHSTDREWIGKEKDPKPILPEKGFHLLAACLDKGKQECLMHKSYGSKGHEGSLSVYTPSVGYIPEENPAFDDGICVQPIHISTENRINMSQTRQTTQNFKERYMSGEFYFEVNVTNCTLEETGLLIETIMYLQRLGRGYNAGYGHVKATKIGMFERDTEKQLELNGDYCNIKEIVIDKPIPDQIQVALKAWYNYLESILIKL